MNSFAVLGGDKRNVAIAESLFFQGYSVKLYGFDYFDRPMPMQCKRLDETLSCADVVIGPVPCAQHGELLNAPFHNRPLTAAEVFGHMCAGKLFMAGMINTEIMAQAQAHNIHAIDLLTREELLIANAIPTAEGAIKIAIEETDVTLHGSPALVIGYGRIGTVLAAGLRGLGAQVCVAVDTLEAAARVKSAGHQAVFSREMSLPLRTAAVVFNTVPATVLDKCNMPHIDKSTVLIDLASPPYGINATDAKAAGLKVLYAASLPGKTAPVTAGKYILDAVMQILDENGGVL